MEGEGISAAVSSLERRSLSAFLDRISTGMGREALS